MMVPTTAASHKASGLTVVAEVEHEVFWSVLRKMERPVVLAVRSGVPKTHKYLTQYGGYYFLAKSKEPLDFTQVAEVIAVRKIHTSTDWLSL